jgi:MerR family transcriptional regulator/heat shock protein HspR
MTARAEGVFAISVAARMASMEIQNLRVYERRGLVAPDRTPGGTRLYSADDVARLVRIGELLADGLNLAGIARVMDLEIQVARLRAENARLGTQHTLTHRKSHGTVQQLGLPRHRRRGGDGVIGLGPPSSHRGWARTRWRVRQRQLAISLASPPSHIRSGVPRVPADRSHRIRGGAFRWYALTHSAVSRGRRCGTAP